MANEQYYILAGVRRAVAALRAGRTDIVAQIIVAGQSDVHCRVNLNQLHSPKAVVPRDFRYIRDVEYPTAVLGLDLAAIFIEPLGTPGQTGSTPLSQVQLI